MPPVIKAEDQLNLVATTEFPYAKWKFSHFNQVQSRCLDYYDKDNNGLIAANTSSGKTVIAEQFLSYEIRKRGGKGMFLVPLRALAREKVDDWTNKNYHFGDLKISICTGDYRLTKERAKELAAADLIIMTSEMLNNLCRNNKSEKADFLNQIGTIAIDEAHGLSASSRGSHLEVGLMKFTQINPKARLVLLSATMPNVDEIADWVSYSLTKRDTFMLKSNFRPVPLTIHYETYCDDAKRYDLVEEEKVNKAMDIVEWYPDDKFLIFAHTKRTGEMMKQHLRQAGIEAAFHNADLATPERVKIEDRFRNDPKFRVIIATSTLSAGLNLPARRVIILGVHRGLGEVESQEIIQSAGRSGRLGIDPMGDAYILIPESKEAEYRLKFSKPNRIESQLLEKSGDKYKTLAFHLVSEIHHGDVKTTEDVHLWFKRSLAYFQNKSLEATIVDSTLDSLKKCGAIGEENGILSVKPIGKVSSMFYFSPFDVSDLYFNFKALFEEEKEDNDYLLSMALGNIDSQRMNIVSRFEKDEMSMYQNKVRTLMVGKFFNDASCKAGFCYFNLLNGINSQACFATQRTLQFDFNRLSQVLQSLDGLAGHWEMVNWIKMLESRITNGVPSHLINLCRLPNIAKVRATKLYDAGFKTVEEIADADVEKLKKLLGMKQEAVEQIMKDAQIIALT